MALLAPEPPVLFGTELFGQTKLFLYVQKDIQQLVRNDTFQFFGHKYFYMRKQSLWSDLPKRIYFGHATSADMLNVIINW